MITLNGNNFNYLVSFNIDSANYEQLPQWINEVESMDITFYNKELSNVSYGLRVNNAQKWILDKILRNHVSVNLTDNLYGLNNNVYLLNIDANLDFANYEYPWFIKISMVGAF